MQAANGSQRSQAGQKRTSSRRDKSNIVVNSKEEEESSGSESSSDVSTSSSSTGDSTSSSSGSSSSTTNSASNNSNSRGKVRTVAPLSLDSIFEEDNFGKFFPVSCAENEAKFYLKRFSRGSVGKCVLFRERWLTPNEFQTISGRKSSKDWKRSIRLKGRILKEYIAQGLFQEHSKTCVCKICCGSDVDMLKQEGEMALAAKRRRLSQADSNPLSTHTELRPLQSPVAMVTSAMPTNSILAPPPPLISKSSVKRGSSHKTNLDTNREEEEEELLNNNNEVNNEGDYQSNNDVFLGGAQEQAPPSASTDPVPPRRSRRSTHRKHNGHRTELGTFTNKPSQWDAEEVSEFLQLQGYGNYSASFVNNEIDGQSMFLLKETHLMDRFQMKLGPALNLIDLISRLRHPPIN